MFIVNQKGDKCVKIESVSSKLEYYKITEKELDKVFEALCLVKPEKIDEEVENYIASNNSTSKLLEIIVNNEVFGRYSDIDGGKRIYRKIIDAIMKGYNLINLSLEDVK